MADARRIWLRGCDGSIVAAMDVTDVPHENTQAAMTLVIATRCDLGEWHEQKLCVVPCWGPSIKGGRTL